MITWAKFGLILLEFCIYNDAFELSVDVHVRKAAREACSAT